MNIKNDLPFGVALIAAKNGERIARKGWNGKGVFVFQRPSDVLPVNFLPSVKSLPNSTKAFLVGQNKDIEFTAYLCMYSSDGKVVNGWLASQSDILAEDWEILD